jgi:hypothetical protein
MVADPRHLRPGELCRLLNSTPLGEVVNERQLKRHRMRAGLRIGDSRHVDLIRYVAWMLQVRHTPSPQSANVAPTIADLAEAARGAAALGSQRKPQDEHGQVLTSKQQALLAAVLTEPTYAAAAIKAGVSQTTLYRWMNLPAFRWAYRQARRELVEFAIGRIQSATGQAVETLLAVARDGRRDSDRVRAAVALLHLALRGLREGDTLHGEQEPVAAAPSDTADVVQMLAARLGQLDAAELPTGEKGRLTATLADALLRAINISVLDKRLQALQAVLLGRKEKSE